MLFRLKKKNKMKNDMRVGNIIEEYISFKKNDILIKLYMIVMYFKQEGNLDDDLYSCTNEQNEWWGRTCSSDVLFH